MLYGSFADNNLFAPVKSINNYIFSIPSFFALSTDFLSDLIGDSEYFLRQNKW